MDWCTSSLGVDSSAGTFRAVLVSSFLLLVSKLPAEAPKLPWGPGQASRLLPKDILPIRPECIL